ncbi:MAG: hypothetical protein ACR2QW_05955, partial [bacterium]
FVEQSMQQVEQFFFSQIEAAKDQASVNESLDSRATAQALLGLFLGLRVLTRANARQPTIDAITSRAMMLME